MCHVPMGTCVCSTEPSSPPWGQPAPTCHVSMDVSGTGWGTLLCHPAVSPPLVQHPCATLGCSRAGCGPWSVPHSVLEEGVAGAPEA